LDWTSAMFKTAQIRPEVQAHLKRVYASLFATVLAATVGAQLYSMFHFIGSSASFLIGLGLIFWMTSVPEQETAKRQGILAAFGFLEGHALGPILELAADIDTSIVPMAFGCTAVVFACFSLAAMFAQRRSYLYLGGMLSSSLSLLVTLNLLNIFFRSSSAALFSIYFGVLVFSGFVIFDTQLIIERADMGHTDYVVDALNLFLDAVNIFVRLIAILAKNKGEKRRK